MDFPESSEDDRQRIFDVDNKIRFLHDALAMKSETYDNLQSVFENSEIQKVILESTAIAWHDDPNSSSENLTDHALEAAYAMFATLGDSYIDLMNQRKQPVRQLLATASTHFLNSTAAKILETDRPSHVAVTFGGKLSAMLRNNKFKITNNGTSEHPDYHVENIL